MTVGLVASSALFHFRLTLITLPHALGLRLMTTVEFCCHIYARADSIHMWPYRQRGQTTYSAQFRLSSLMFYVMEYGILSYCGSGSCRSMVKDCTVVHQSRLCAFSPAWFDRCTKRPDAATAERSWWDVGPKFYVFCKQERLCDCK
jgi:hypothetical protein